LVTSRIITVLVTMTFPWRPHSLVVFLNQDNRLCCRQPNTIDPFDKGWNTVIDALYMSHVQPQDSNRSPLSRSSSNVN
jgi:hypothetical protein